MPDFLLVCTKFNFGWDSARDLAERAYSAPQTPSVMVKELAALPLPKTYPLGPSGLDCGLSRTTFGNVLAPVHATCAIILPNATGGFQNNLLEEI